MQPLLFLLSLLFLLLLLLLCLVFLLSLLCLLFSVVSAVFGCVWSFSCPAHLETFSRRAWGVTLTVEGATPYPPCHLE